MSTPQNPQTAPEGYELKKKKPWYKKIWVWVIIVIVLIILATTLGGGGDDSSDTNTTAEPTATAQQDTQAEESADDTAQADSDQPAALGSTVDMNGLAMTVNSIYTTAPDVFGDTHVCADVAIANNSGEAVDINPGFDFKLTDPNGVQVNTTFGEEATLQTATLNDGGNMAGGVCFDDPATPGEYILTYEPGLSFSRNTAQWVGQL